MALLGFLCTEMIYNFIKFLPQPQGPWGDADLRFLSSQPDTSFTLRDHGYGASVSCGVPVYSPALAGTHYAYQRRDGQAELTWVAGSDVVPRGTASSRGSLEAEFSLSWPRPRS